MQFVKPMNSEPLRVMSDFIQPLINGLFTYDFKKFAFLDLLEVRSLFQLGDWMMD
jgi:hypothetical protein